VTKTKNEGPSIPFIPQVVFGTIMLKNVYLFVQTFKDLNHKREEHDLVWGVFASIIQEAKFFCMFNEHMHILLWIEHKPKLV
jgi:hypothetical protein